MKKVILAERDNVIAQYIGRILSINGFSITVIDESRNLIEKIVSLEPELLLISSTFHEDENWLTVIRKIKMKTNKKIILLTSYCDMFTIRMAYEAGVQSVLSLPFNEEIFIETLNENYSLVNSKIQAS